MKRISMNSLVIVFDNNVLEQFPCHELINMNVIRKLIFGDKIDNINYQIVLNEFIRIIKIKLSVGERVVIDNVPKDIRLLIINSIIEYGVPIYYITKSSIDDIDVLLGDNDKADVIISDKFYFKIINPIDDIKKAVIEYDYSGLTVIPDIHGSMSSLESAIHWSIGRNHLMIFLGDIIDYGNDSIECVNLIYRLIMAGRAIIVMGNHEKKILKVVNNMIDDKQSFIKISDANRKTINEIYKLPGIKKKQWINRFKVLCDYSRYHWVCDNILFAHGGAEPEMFNITTSRLEYPMSEIAMYGTRFDHSEPKFEWINRIPKNNIVIVGHTIRARDFPVIEIGKLGGEVHFLDTGCQKGGHLTTVDIRYVEGVFRITNRVAH